MSIARLALRRPYTFIVMALLIAILDVISIVTMPTDIFPYINIPVVGVTWPYTGTPRLQAGLGFAALRDGRRSVAYTSPCSNPASFHRRPRHAIAHFEQHTGDRLGQSHAPT
jgi:Cation/multidrug efflux pump